MVLIIERRVNRKVKVGDGADHGSASAPVENAPERSPDIPMSAEYVGFRGPVRLLSEASPKESERGVGGAGIVNRPVVPDTGSLSISGTASGPRDGRGVDAQQIGPG